MKRKSSNASSLKLAALAVPAAALMLGAAQAGSTVGLNFQAWYYNSGQSPQTVGFGSGYQTTGFPVTAGAFGVSAANWFNADPMPCQAPVSGYATFGGVNTTFAGGLTALVNAPNTWQSGIGELVAGWNPESVTPGNDEVTWGYLDDGNSTGKSPSVAVVGLTAQFPNGYVVQTIAANAGVKTFDGVNISDGATTNTVAYSTYYVTNPQSDGYVQGGTVGISASSGTFTADTINIYCLPKTSGNRSVLAGFLITDQPVVSQSPAGAAVNAGGSLTLSGSAVGIAPLSYQWQHAGTNIPGATAATYTKANVGAQDAGDYQLVATNLYGVGTSLVATVTVAMSPTINADIQSVTNYLGLAHLFTVSASGAQPLSYQWTHAGTNLPGATTSSLLLNSLQASDAGDYQVIVTNSIGSTPSSVATLSLVASLPYEGFAYADGDIAGQNGGAGWADVWSQSSTTGGNAVGSPGATYQDATNKLVTTGSELLTGAAGSPDFVDDRPLAATVEAAGTVYVSFIGAFPNGGWQGIQLLQDSTAACFLGQGWSYEGWGCGSFPYPEIVSTKASTVQSFVVYRFDFTSTNTQVRLYVNPTLAAEPVTADATGTLSLFKFNRVRVMAHALSAGLVDEFRVGGTWATVAPAVPRTDPPVLVRGLPTSVYAYAGGVATMSIGADGAPLLHYQWWKGTAPVGTDSATLRLTGLSTADTGDYSVTVSNAYGTTNSLASHLSVAAAPDLYTAIVAPDAPSAYWPLTELVGPSAFDYSGAGHDAAQNGGLTLGATGPRPPAYQGFNSGKVAYLFDGSSASLSCGTGPSLSGTTDFTLEAWVNTTNTATSQIIQQRSSTAYNGEYYLTINGNGTVGFLVYGGGGSQFSFSSPSNARRVNDGKWHHVAAVRSGTNGSIYIDGSLMASASGTLRPLDPTIPTFIGWDPRAGGNYFNGLMCDVAVYNYALSAARIGDHAYKGILATSPLVLSNTPGGFIEDSKPAGTPHPGPNYGATWVASVTDSLSKTRTGVEQFAGSEVVIPADADFNAPTGTIMFWLKATAPLPGSGNEGAMLVDRRTTNGTVIVLSDAGAIFVQCAGGANSFSAGYLPDGNWHHVAVTYDQSASGMMEIFVDGVSNGSQPNTAAWSWPAAQELELAKSHDGYWRQYFGQMDDFRIYNRVLTATEITSVVSGDALVDMTALKVRYNFDTALGVGTSLTWPLGLLQSTLTLSPPSWTPVSGAPSPYPWLLPAPSQPTNAATFYRLRL